MKRPSPFLTIALLIVTNLVPVFGVLWLKWDITTLLFLYWVETVIIGLFSLAKIIIINRHRKTSPANLGFFVALTTIPLLIYLQFILASTAGPGRITAETFLPLLKVIPGSVILLLPYLTSFLMDFIGNKQYIDNGTDTDQYQSAKVLETRIMVMHFVLFFGLFMKIIWGTSWGLLMLLVGVKMLLDLRQQRKQFINQNTK